LSYLLCLSFDRWPGARDVDSVVDFGLGRTLPASAPGESNGGARQRPSFAFIPASGLEALVAAVLFRGRSARYGTARALDR
jgi:hypothetical protein